MILVVAEKPEAARSMAKVLKCTHRENGYFEGNNYVVTWAFGHLLTLKQPGDYKEEWQKWEIANLPIIPKKYELKLIPDTARQFKVIKSLIQRNDVEYIINGGDAGREGLLIQNWIYTACGNRHPVKVLWTSSLTDEALEKAFDNLHENSEFEKMFEAAETRSIMDWIIGINYTRLYTKKKGNNDVLLSIGRCQTPILNLIVNRDNEIKNFKKSKFYNIEVDLFKDGITFKGVYINSQKAATISTPSEAENISSMIGSTVKVENFDNEVKEKAAPLLYDITSLQQVMNNKYGYTADKTLECCQSLYEKHKILSYPRTSSRYLTSDLKSEIEKHIECINFGPFEKLIKGIGQYDIDKYFNDKKVTDHHALIPTINKDIEKIYPELREDEKDVFNEIVLSLIAIFYPKYKYSVSILITESNGLKFLSKGKVEINKGWKIVKADYLEDTEESEENSILPEVTEGTVKVLKKEVIEKETRAKPHFTDSSILGQMIKFNIGTQATRHTIIEKLLDRKYILRDNKKIISTPLGEALISSIDIEDLKSVELTSYMEEQLQEIEAGTKTKKEVLQEVYKTLEKNISIIKQSTDTVSEAAVNSQKLICPVCKKGYILENTKSYYCSNWKEGCKFKIWKKIAEKNITQSMARDLIVKGKTNLLKGFKSNSGKKFDAYLTIDQGEVKFKFKK